MNRGIWNFAFVFGLVFTVVGVLMLLNQMRLSFQCTERTEGIIDSGDIWNKEAALMLNFKVDAEKYRLAFSYSHEIHVGMTVTVVYNPAKISRHSCYILEDAPNTIKMGIICIIAGIIAMLVGYGVSIGLFKEVWYI